MKSIIQLLTLLSCFGMAISPPRAESSQETLLIDNAEGGGILLNNYRDGEGKLRVYGPGSGFATTSKKSHSGQHSRGLASSAESPWGAIAIMALKQTDVSAYSKLQFWLYSVEDYPGCTVSVRLFFSNDSVWVQSCSEGIPLLKGDKNTDGGWTQVTVSLDETAFYHEMGKQEFDLTQLDKIGILVNAKYKRAMIYFDDVSLVK